jgi:hypothetical protein
MADEIPNANVIRLSKDGDRWAALIGPDPQRGLLGFGSHPHEATHNLLLKCYRLGWCWDETWAPKA